MNIGRSHRLSAPSTEIAPETKIMYGVGTGVPGHCGFSPVQGLGLVQGSNTGTQKPLHLRWWRGFDLRFHVPNMSAHEGIRTPNLLIRSQDI
jgi:hypothetical protein